MIEHMLAGTLFAFALIPGISSQDYTGLALLAFRVSIGALFVIHGIPKLRGEFRQAERKKMKELGVPHGIYDVVAVYESFGGILLVVGLLTTIVSLLFFLLTAFIIHFNITKLSKPPANKRYVNGWDRDTILLTGTLLLAIVGPGLFSLDSLLHL